MPEREWRSRITDILNAIRSILEYIDGVEEETFGNDAKTIDAILFNFMILGEAANRIPETVRLRYPDVPWREMVNMRNFIVHVYWGTHLEIVWRTIHDDLRPLVPRLEMILADGA